MNEFEIHLQSRLEKLKEKRKNEGSKTLSESDLIGLLIMETSYGELFIIQRDFPNVDVTQIIEKVIYLEGRRRGYNPDEALKEMKKQISDRGK